MAICGDTCHDCCPLSSVVLWCPPLSSIVRSAAAKFSSDNCHHTSEGHSCSGRMMHGSRKELHWDAIAIIWLSESSPNPRVAHHFPYICTYVYILHMIYVYRYIILYTHSYNTVQYITLHCITLDYTTLQYITLHTYIIYICIIYRNIILNHGILNFRTHPSTRFYEYVVVHRVHIRGLQLFQQTSNTLPLGLELLHGPYPSFCCRLAVCHVAILEASSALGFSSTVSWPMGNCVVFGDVYMNLALT